MSNDRNIVFINHAAPEDNDFSIWLASRLQLLGYEVWIDKNALLGGEKFWEEIDQVIRNKTIKFLMVYSQNICQKDKDGNILLGKLKDGIYKEYSLAENIGKQKAIDDFILLLNLDGAEYNLFIGADRLNQISFYDNWADGFKQLEKKLKKDNVNQINSLKDKNFGDWYESQYLVPNRIIIKKELYYSNWWPIELPEYFYIYQFHSDEQAKAIIKQGVNFPISRIVNCISSFEPELKFETLYNGVTNLVIAQKTFTIKISDILLGFESTIFPTHRDTENHLKQLLKQIFHLLMKKRGMFWYEMANKRYAYFYTPANLVSQKVKFKYPYRTNRIDKTKNLIGRHKFLGKWHFAISEKPILYPLVAYSLKNHLIFTDDGFKVWRKNDDEIDTAKIHRHRRMKGKTIFNEGWRDLLIAFLHGLKNEEKIEIVLSQNFTLKMPITPELFWSWFGYYDPKDKSRHGILSSYEYDDIVEDETADKNYA